MIRDWFNQVNWLLVVQMFTFSITGVALYSFDVTMFPQILNFFCATEHEFGDKKNYKPAQDP